MLLEHWSEYTRFFTSLLVILDPFMAIPILLALTEGYTDEERRRVVRIASATVASVLIVAALTGEALLTFLGTSLGSFRVGGGVVLFLMSLAMLQAKTDRVRTSPAERDSASNRASVAVVPLAIPLLAGPGAMSNVIIAMQRSQTTYHHWAIIACILAVCVLSYVVLNMANRIGDTLGDIGLTIVNRLFGLILAAIAVEIVANGLKQLFPILAHG
ncbi:MAG: MarC family protein [Chromatiales bacterium]|nr:MarC family protein [Chromatiales bacterium]